MTDNRTGRGRVETVAVHFHAPGPTGVFKRRMRCSTCGVRRAMIIATYEWYDTDMTCLGCGERWEGGWRSERPFERGWRMRNIDAARKLYMRNRVMAIAAGKRGSDG